MSPKGKEGSYMAVASLPISLGGFIAGVLSGGLLEGFCPKGGSEEMCPLVWMVSGFISATTILFMIVLRF